MYIVIDHNKLLKKSSSIKEDELIEPLKIIIKRNGGLISEISNFMSFFPSNYEYSKNKLLNCIKEIHNLLDNNHDIVGFSIIIDNAQPTSDFEFNEIQKRLNLQTFKSNKVWFTEDSYVLVSHLITGKKNKELYLIDDLSLKKVFHNNEIPNNINKNLQNRLDSLNSSINYLNIDLDYNLYSNILYWSKRHGYKKAFYIDFNGSSDYIISFLDFLISYSDEFNPDRDLNSDERKQWYLYIELYNNLSKRTFNYYILDDAIIHLKRLILLWVEAYSKRYKSLFIIKINEKNSDEMDQLWTLLSLINNTSYFIFSKNNRGNITNLPELPSLNDALVSGLPKYLESKENPSLMMLYIIALANGTMLISDILKILSNLNYNELILAEEIENYKRDGLLLGHNYLYPTNELLLKYIININEVLAEQWKSKFLRQFLLLKFNKIFIYSYTISLIGLTSDYKPDALNSLFLFIQKLLDLGRPVNISDDFILYSKNNNALKNILEYKRIREKRLSNQIDNVKVLPDNLENPYKTSLDFLVILNKWTTNNSVELIDDCKKLYYIYQTNGESFKESRIKTVFALSLLSVGRVGEAVDYFELNCNFSKSISDIYSYIRNVCFLAMSLFVKGDISGTLRVSKEFIGNNWLFYNTKWFLYISFIRARALSEINDNSTALKILDESIIIAKKYNYLDILYVLINWKGKILFYLNRLGESRETILSNHESNEGYYFLSEIEYFSGNIDKALTYILKTNFDNDDNQLFDENIKWNDGYFIIEEFFNRSRKSTVLKEEVTNFKYLLKILNGDKKSYDEYTDVIGHITNNSLGIYNYKYLYYFYLSKNNENELNNDNLLNKVIRLLQQRASNLAEHNQKHLYLNNFFNGRILEESSRKKLF